MRNWAPAFLGALAATPNISAACRAADIARQTAYDERELDPEFARAWDDAVNTATDDLVDESYRRARYGVREPVIYKGQLCGEWMKDGKVALSTTEGAEFVPLVVYKPSDALAMFLLKAHRPEIYRETVQQEHSGGLKIVVEYADENHQANLAPPPSWPTSDHGGDGPV